MQRLTFGEDYQGIAGVIRDVAAPRRMEAAE